MKILLATYWSIPHVGGVWTYMVQLKESLESMGHEIDLLGYGEENQIVHIVNENRKVEKEQLMPMIEQSVNQQSFPQIFDNQLVHFTEIQRYVYELAAIYLGLEKYDLIHAQDVISSGCLKRVKPKNTPLVATLHGSVAHEIRHQLTTIHRKSSSDVARAYFDHLEQVGAVSADATIVANNWLKNLLTKEFDTPEEQISVLHYGYDIDSFLKRKDIKSAEIPQTDKKIILFTGRLVENKGVQHLLAALSHLKEVRDDWVCWIAGDGERMAGLRILCGQLGLENDVVFMKKRDDVPYLLSIADVYVLPSLLENQPLSVIEAQLAGLPVIVSDAGGLPEIVEHNVTGMVTPKGDAQAICDSINQLLEDETLRKTLGSNAHKFAMEYWNMEEAVNKVLEIYQQTLK